MNRAIEFHDSTLRSATLEGNLRVELSAYVHASDDEPGRDAGTGWEQDVTLVLTEAIAEAMPTMPVDITDGRVSVGGQVFAGLLPLPFTHSGQVQLELRCIGSELRAIGTGLAVIERGEPRFVEEVPPLA